MTIRGHYAGTGNGGGSEASPPRRYKRKPGEPGFNKRRPHPHSEMRSRQAQADFQAYGTPELAAPCLVDPPRKQPAAGTHGHGTHCPGAIAFGLLGAGVWRPGSAGPGT